MSITYILSNFLEIKKHDFKKINSIGPFRALDGHKVHSDFSPYDFSVNGVKGKIFNDKSSEYSKDNHLWRESLWNRIPDEFDGENDYKDKRWWRGRYGIPPRYGRALKNTYRQPFRMGKRNQNPSDRVWNRIQDVKLNHKNDKKEWRFPYRFGRSYKSNTLIDSSELNSSPFEYLESD